MNAPWVIIGGLVFLAGALQANSKKWVNCIENQSCSPFYYGEPGTVEELQNCIREAVSSGHMIRPVGLGHSISDVVSTDGYLLSLKNLNKVFSVDREKKTVRVEAGITLRNLNEELAQYGLALPNQAMIVDISLGGALAMAVHGTGHTGTLASFIKEIELLTADGNFHQISASSHPEVFKAATVSLGALGIIYAVTLECVPTFYLRETREILDLEAIIKSYKEIHAANDFFQFAWDVQTQKAEIRCWNRVPEDAPGAALSYETLGAYVFDKNDTDRFSEISFPIDFFPDVLKVFDRVLDKYVQLGATLTYVDLRFVDQDQLSYLSPAFSGPVGSMTIALGGEDKYLEFFRELEGFVA